MCLSGIDPARAVQAISEAGRIAVAIPDDFFSLKEALQQSVATALASMPSWGGTERPTWLAFADPDDHTAMLTEIAAGLTQPGNTQVGGQENLKHAKKKKHLPSVWRSVSKGYHSKQLAQMLTDSIWTLAFPRLIDLAPEALVALCDRLLSMTEPTLPVMRD